MDLLDISKAANRKRINTDVEKLREKVSRETAKIIKLKVAQDTAYWDLKEKLQTVERNHERLQQNMVEAQMQNETVSAQYQDELRLRPETLNKLEGTREICNALEEYAGRVRGSLQRCAGDRAALSDAYARAARAVDASRAQHAQRAAVAASAHAALRDQLKLNVEHSAQLAASAGEARAQLAAATADAERMRESRDALTAQLARRDALIEEREKSIRDLRDELKQTAYDFTTRLELARSRVSELECEVDAVEAMRIALKKAETRSLEAEREATRVNAELTVVAAACDEAKHQVENLDRQLQEAQSMNECLKEEVRSRTAKNEDLEKEVHGKDQSIHSLETKLNELDIETKERAHIVETLTTSLRTTITERDEARVARDDSLTTAETLREDLANITRQLEEYKVESEAAAENAERALAERAATIARLMRDVTAEAEARARLDTALGDTRADLDALTREKMRLEDDVRRLNATVRSKEEESAEQMKIILEVRAEKERLQEKIRNMQNTIDNIQKELTRDPPGPPTSRREPPEHDDNAVPAPPTPVRQGVFAKPSKGAFVTPEPRPIDTMLYNFLSDSSVDDTLDPVEVNRRFEALSRGAVLPATSLRALKRRHNFNAEQAELSLSQVKTDMNTRARTFFKNKRTDAKIKKQK